MKSFPLLLAVTLAATALAGCTDVPGTGDDNTTTTTPATTTPVATPEGGDANESEEMPLECTGDYTTESSNATRLGMPELTYTIQEPSDADPCYAFVGPENATSGWNVFTLEHPGMQFHIMPMYFLGDRTQADFLAESSPQGETPAWAVPSGAVGGVTPGQNGSVAIDLDVGNYVYFCPIGGHMFQGMIGQLNVTEAANESAAPTEDLAIELVDYNFTIPANVSANVSVIKVTNNGTEPHEAPLVRLEGNATAMEFILAIESPSPTGPPPGALIGGVNVIAPGQTVYLLVDLEAGKRYALACFVPSPAHGGAPHVAIGPMVAEFAAEA